MLNMPWNSHSSWSPPTPTINYFILTQSNPELCFILVSNWKVLEEIYKKFQNPSTTLRMKTCRISHESDYKNLWLSLIKALTVIIFIASTWRRYRLNSDYGRAKHETGFQIFMMILVHFFLPVLNIYPAVFIWYDYMTNEQLAYSPQGKGYLIETANIAIPIFIATKIMQHFFLSI